MPQKRIKIPKNLKYKVLTEAGFRCAVPTCRSILALDIHHMLEVHKGGGNTLSNLVALCPTCHALYHRGDIPSESIVYWKTLIRDLNASPNIKDPLEIIEGRVLVAIFENLKDDWAWQEDIMGDMKEDGYGFLDTFSTLHYLAEGKDPYVHMDDILDGIRTFRYSLRPRGKKWLAENWILEHGK